MLIRHLTGDPPAQARRATAALRRAQRLLVTDIVFAESIFVLESYYEAPREDVASAMRALLALPTIAVVSPDVLLRALEVYESQRLHFAEAHLVAEAEATGVDAVLSFDKALRRATSVEWQQP